MPDPILLTIPQLSERFPLNSTTSVDGWGDMLSKMRHRGILKEKKHFIVWHYPRKRREYNLRSVVIAICREAKKETPWPRCYYLMETYYDQFCEILASADPVDPASLHDKTP